MVLVKGNDFSDSSSSQKTDGTSTPCEAKKSIREEDLAQMIKVCTISSFILVPIIAIEPENARICLYNAHKDVLLISGEFQWMDHDLMTFNYAGATLLWAVINHR